MSKQIWKFQLNATASQIVRMPAAASIVLVAADAAGVLCIWARCETEAPPEHRMFEVIATGAEEPDPDRGGRLRRAPSYIGSAVMPDGYVWHVFERFE
jgi:hypothetical protein